MAAVKGEVGSGLLLLPEADQGTPLAFSESPSLHLTWAVMPLILLGGFSEVMQLKVFCNL